MAQGLDGTGTNRTATARPGSGLCVPDRADRYNPGNSNQPSVRNTALQDTSGVNPLVSRAPHATHQPSTSARPRKEGFSGQVQPSVRVTRAAGPRLAATTGGRRTHAAAAAASRRRRSPPRARPLAAHLTVWLWRRAWCVRYQPRAHRVAAPCRCRRSAAGPRRRGGRKTAARAARERATGSPLTTGSQQHTSAAGTALKRRLSRGEQTLRAECPMRVDGTGEGATRPQLNELGACSAWPRGMVGGAVQ